MTGNKTARDWDGAVALRRAGMPVARIALETAIPATSLGRYFKQHGVVPDLTGQIQQATRAKLQAGPVAGGSAAEIVEDASNRAVALVSNHLKLAARGRALLERLFDDLEQGMLCRAEIEADIEADTQDDKAATRRTRMQRAVALPGHAGTLNELTTVLAKLVNVERQALSVDEPREQNPYAGLTQAQLHERVRALLEDNALGDA
ncbi:hypothetical protein SAMN02745857_02764 [Andreprevotia lacus DSM 23236]|jgi:uncharacterized membrane protein YccC|uniref:Uncharacterized protein n=1 Tax=Andreprevotia lacus DSM 23236 TaxID=1121001 RepID=A0A1W1XUN0_9NEIS|nr:hypothetical protein [Andreprevotia lacus]SMC27241.1 hypothetical protein SAMN02745857_02764 [Andreprevotia lacus DSM 23236]